MTVLNISEAAAATGLNKTTVLRSIKSGKISGTRDPLGQWQIDAAEIASGSSPRCGRNRCKDP